MKKKLFGFLRTNRKGLALISVLGVVTLATILILALFAVSDAEFKAAKNYFDGATARQMADNAINLVVGQIQAGATGEGVTGSGPSSARTIWASQPGAIRVYQSSGVFTQGRKLYSSQTMVVNGNGAGAEFDMASDAPPANWSSRKAEWVDLNEPVLRTVVTNANGPVVKTFFPILDPRASIPLNNVNAVEGFSYSSTLPGAGALDGVVTTGGSDALRVPMPVQWLYVLKDGSMGSVSSGGGNGIGTWAGVTGAGTPTKDNPIVGRVAFWTDDETCRVNINTAGEPGYYALPTVFHGRDGGYQNNPPVIWECQRYPGHPATVALSSILFPNPNHTSASYDGDGYPFYPQQFRDLKRNITNLVPRLPDAGSDDGTKSYAPDDFSNNRSPEIQTMYTAAQKASEKHLFASVDEWIFENIQTSDTKRSPVISHGFNLIDQDVLERGRFFLTAHSRAPELNMFGMPRVAIWPVPDASLDAPAPQPAKFRTGYDSTIAQSSSLASVQKDQRNISLNSYYFSRRDANSAVEDIGRGLQSPGLVRNGKLMTYLNSIITLAPMPGGSNFGTKYGRDAQQILVEIFDYVRTTNLFDSFLDQSYVDDRKGRDFWDEGGNAPGVNIPAGSIKYNSGKPQDLWIKRPKEFTYYTYTAPRFDTVRRIGDLGGVVPTSFQKDYNPKVMTTGVYPGHGQVRPIEWQIGGQTYKGFGRFPTISEVAIQFICTGDGKSDDGSYKIQKDGNIIRSGGKTAKMIDPKVENKREAFDNGRKFWYSNIPPFPGRKLFEKWGCDFGRFGTGAASDPARHPGFNPMNWNCTLDWNAVQGGVPLEENEKRIQIALQIELFVPAVGYTKYTPDFTLVLDGKALAGLMVKDSSGSFKPIFNTTTDQVVQSTTAYMGSALGKSVTGLNVSPLGGSYGSAPLMSGRQAKGIGKMPQDSAYNTNATSDAHSAMLNFPLVSSFFTVPRDKNIEFKAPTQPLKIDIYASHDWQGLESKKNTTPSQSVNISFEGGTSPVPYLVVYSTEKRKYIDSNGNQYLRETVHAPRWWAFNNGGAVQRYEGRGKPGGATDGMDWSGVKEHVYDGNTDFDTRGRFNPLPATSVTTQDPFNPVATGQGATVAMNSMIYGYSSLPNFNGTKSTAADLANADDFVDFPGKSMGKYGYYGSDSLRSMVPRHGDYRLLAARPSVPATTWVKHRVWAERQNDMFAHSLMGAASDGETGCDVGGVNPGAVDATNRMVKGAWYPLNQVPDTPLTAAASSISNTRGDFDNGPGDMRDGAYINKADDGNLSVDQFWYGSLNKFYVTRNAYFMSSFLQLPSTGSFFTPNRMISSPGVFGSLPTGVYGSQTSDPDEQKNGVPWRTLLFRPDSTGTHAGGPTTSPADHHFLDLFWMPVVQPYAISDSYSTAGKINLNYQMLPFPHIKRSTGLHAVMKGELVTAVASRDADYRRNGGAGKGVPNANNPVVYKLYKDDNKYLGQVNKAPRELWGSGGDNSDPMEWHRHIDMTQTLKQMDERFRFAATGAGYLPGLFRTASQICEIHLIPKASNLRTSRGEPSLTNLSPSNRQTSMGAFWRYNNLTGDNMRERPYSNIYQKVTTRSNSYRVYFLAQTIRKAKSVDSATIDLSKDSVTGEYRGSALLDRYLDFDSVEKGISTTAFPDYADGSNPFTKPSLETMYHYRVLEMKQFSP